MKSLDFPLPYPSQCPNDDLGTARLMLSAVAFAMEDGKAMASSEVQSLFSVLCAVMTKLDVIQLFLDDCECPDMEAQCRTARRSWVMQNGGAK